MKKTKNVRKNNAQWSFIHFNLEEKNQFKYGLTMISRTRGSHSCGGVVTIIRLLKDETCPRRFCEKEKEFDGFR